jgi:hypothetical protein
LDGPKILKVKIRGYGELSQHGNGFTSFYSYSIGGGVRRENHEKHTLDGRPVSDGQVHLAT